MTLLLAHPEAESLGRFVEGTLDDPERASVVQHIADCDDCRMLVVDAAEFIEPAKTESNKWWMGIAASLALVAAIGTVTYQHLRDLKGPVKKDYAKLSTRPLEARLSGFAYVPHRVYRGAEDGEDTQLDTLRVDAADLMELHTLRVDAADLMELRGDDAKTLNAKGTAYLLAASTTHDANEIRSERTNAVALLQAAVDRAPDNASYQTDLAAALLTTGDKANHDLALAHLKKALAIDPRNQEALFNEGLALSDSNPKAAIAAFKSYLNVDSSSKWAEEARRNIGLLEEEAP